MLTLLRRRALALGVTSGLLAAPFLLSPPLAAPAAAVESELPEVNLDQTVSGRMAPMWQTNAEVDAMAVSRGVVYAGGQFTRVRPPGAAAGRNEVARTYLAAFNATTGALVTGFNATLNGRVQDLAVSPDGSRLYAVGNFSTVNGQPRRRVVALNPTTGALVAGWQANADAVVSAVDATADAVYVGGDFLAVKGVARERIAALSPATGDVLPGFTATLDVRANAIEAVPEAGRVLVGGNFNVVNGTRTGAMASLDPVTGALEEWKANATQPINDFCPGRVTDVVAADGYAYVTGEGDWPGCYEGTYRARVTDGELEWVSSCLGASQGVTVMRGILYKASHQHDCAFTKGDARGGYVGGTSRETFVRWHLLGQRVETGEFVHWSPDTNGAGPVPVGPQVIRNDGNQLFVGGDFTKVDGVNQQGLVRFSQGSQAAPIRPAPPVVQPIGAGRVRVSWPAVYDADSGTLTYRLYRGNTTTGTPVHTATVESWPWTRPVMSFDDTRPPGSTATYRLTVTDGTHVSAGSSAGSAVVPTSDPTSYADLVRSLGANLHWDFDEAGAAGARALPDRSGSGFAGSLEGGATAVDGLFPGDGAARLDGTSGYATSDSSRALTPSFTQTLWFRTTSVTGGSLLGTTDVRTGDGTFSDRAVTMDNNGNIVFSVHTPPRSGSPDPLGPWLINLRLEGPTYNDGRWHQVVASWDRTSETSGTGRLYVDGIQRFEYTGNAGGLTNGYQRVGYTDLAREQAVFGWNFYRLEWPATEHFDGSVDEVATFPRALTPAEVARLYATGVFGSYGVAPENRPPTASFAATTQGLTASLNASASTDADGTVASYAWDFGDGSTGTGATVQHPYAAAGDYTVRLTVTDDDGATATATRVVTVTAPAATVDTTVVARGAEWRWYYRSAAPPAGWRALAFDDSGWGRGRAVLGFGTTVATNVDTFAQPTDRPVTAYFRRTFQVPDASDTVRLRLTGVADDGVVIAVNGTEVRRHNMPAGAVAHGTFAASARNTTAAIADPVVVDVPVALLVDGANVVTAETHVNFRRTRDLSFDLEAVLTARP